MPTPREDESRDEFVDRCMGDEEAVEDFPDQDQRFAFCNSEWERAENVNRRLQLTANQNGDVRRETLEGREHVVVPATLVKSQVLNNNLGKTFLPAEEITDTWAQIANHSPVILDHPKRRGQPISARDPSVLNAQGVGRLFNVSAEDGALKGDVFLDPERRDDVDALDVVLERVERGEPVELSTSFPIREIENESGSHEGKAFDKVIRPGGFDHLAVFAEKEGACSVEDGCGLGVNHAGPCDCEEDDVDNQEADEVAESIWARLKERIFNEESTMDPDTLAELSEATGLSEDRLEDMEDEEVEALADHVLPTDEPDADTEHDKADNETVDEPDEGLRAELAELREQVEELSADREAEREELVSTLADNERCPFSEHQLEGKSLDELQGLAQMAKVENYAGQGGPRTADNETAPQYMEPVPYYAENSEED